MLETYQANKMKQEIQQKFQIKIGENNQKFQCYIPSEVLCKMNTDKELKKKVFSSLEKCNKEEFKNSMECTLIFDEEGEMTATLKTEIGNKNQSNLSYYLMYQKLLMQQATGNPYQMNLYSGYNNLYGLNALNSYNLLGNSLFSYRL